MRVDRKQVYKALDSERSYQNKKWNQNTTSSRNEHSLEEWFMYIEDYVNEAKHILSREARQDSDIKCLHIMRKVGALAVSAMEEHGAPHRK